LQPHRLEKFEQAIGIFTVSGTQGFAPFFTPLPPGGGELLTLGSLVCRTLFDRAPACLARCADLVIGEIEESVGSDTAASFWLRASLRRAPRHWSICR
jgi:hypothetical protein